MKNSSGSGTKSTPSPTPSPEPDKPTYDYSNYQEIVPSYTPPQIYPSSPVITNTGLSEATIALIAKTAESLEITDKMMRQLIEAEIALTIWSGPTTQFEG